VSTVFTLHDEGQIHKIRRQSSEGMASRSRGGRRRNILSGLARKFRNAACWNATPGRGIVDALFGWCQPKWAFFL
jgi:hypothetical protein